VREALTQLKQKLNDESYIADDALVTTLYVAAKLNRPLLIEGAAGVGKTEVAKAAARAFGRELVRLQCYEGLDESKALYEWNYQKQLLAIQMGNRGEDRQSMKDLFGEEYLLERPLLKSIRSDAPVVLLIDEIDKADAEFEAFLLELLSEMQVTIPEYGTVRARSLPFIVLTSNHTRPLSEALRRRCAYLYLEYPGIEKEIAILTSKLSGLDRVLAAQVARAVAFLRQSEKVTKKPSVAESLDWASALMALGVEEMDDESCAQTIGFALKNNDDIREMLADDDFIRSLI
jgi:MoxR-like ATPase